MTSRLREHGNLKTVKFSKPDWKLQIFTNLPYNHTFEQSCTN